jgi:carboxypeptidase family protein
MRRVLTLSILMMGFLAVSLTGCGSGGSSTTGATSFGGGGSTAVIQGQVLSAKTSRGPESIIVVALRTALGIGLAEAVTGTPVEGATVELFVGVIDPGETPIGTTLTDGSGNFHFTGLQSGTYTVRVTTTLPPSVEIATVTVGAGDNAVFGVVASSGTPPIVTVAADPFDISNDAQFGHAMNIDQASASCDLSQVIALRQAGNGWGNIAHQCHVPPRVIGLGHPSQGDLDSARSAHGGGKGKGKGKGKKA